MVENDDADDCDEAVENGECNQCNKEHGVQPLHYLKKQSIQQPWLYGIFRTMKHVFFLSVLLVVASGTVLVSRVSGNGGVQKVVEGKYIVHLSSSPIAPFVGEKISMLISFTDLENNLLKEEIGVDVILAKKGAEKGDQPALALRGLRSTGGVFSSGILSLEHSFLQPGLYELFVKFHFLSKPEKIYEPEDFLIEVREPRMIQQGLASWWLFLLGATVVGFLLGFVAARFGIGRK